MAGRAAGRGRSGAAVGGSEGIIASSTGRGDGSRGRGWRPSRPTRIPHATTLDDVLSEIMAMRCYGDQSPPSSLLHKCISFTRWIGNEDQLAQAIFDVVYNNRKRAEQMAILSSQLSCTDTDTIAIGRPFRDVILRRFQSQYKQRKELKRQSVEVWLSMVSFLSYFFKQMKCQGDPLKVLVVPLTTCLSEILSPDDVGDAEIDCACELIPNIGSLLSGYAPERDRDVANLLRQRVLATRTSGRARCALMEVLELRAAGWAKKDDASIFYADASADMV